MIENKTEGANAHNKPAPEKEQKTIPQMQNAQTLPNKYLKKISKNKELSEFLGVEN